MQRTRERFRYAQAVTAAHPLGSVMEARASRAAGASLSPTRTALHDGEETRARRATPQNTRRNNQTTSVGDAMNRTLRLLGTRHLALLTGLLASGAGTAYAQEYQALQTSRSPLVLAAQGSFYVGGQTISQTETELGLGGPTFPPGQIVINQMYVRFMKPKTNEKVPVVMVHGGNLSGKSYETTPDGRMGWDEYFVRAGRTVFVPDQVARARSGFDQAAYNLVRGGINAPAS